MEKFKVVDEITAKSGEGKKLVLEALENRGVEAIVIKEDFADYLILVLEKIQ